MKPHAVTCSLALLVSLLFPLHLCAAESDSRDIAFGLESLHWGMTPAEASRLYPSVTRDGMANTKLTRSELWTLNGYVYEACSLDVTLAFERNNLTAVDFRTSDSTRCLLALWRELHALYGKPSADSSEILDETTWFGPHRDQFPILENIANLSEGATIIWRNLPQSRLLVGFRAPNSDYHSDCNGDKGCSLSLGLERLRWGMTEREALASYPALGLYHPRFEGNAVSNMLETSHFMVAGCRFALTLFF
jgi:hypothetical protein